MNTEDKILKAFREAVLADPKESRKSAFNRFYVAVIHEPDLVRAIIEADFYRRAASSQPKEIGPGNYTLAPTPAAARRAATASERATDAAASKARIAKAIEKTAASVRPFVWLKMIMPNGKKLEDCTGAEIGKFGGVFTEIAKRIKPTQVVGRHLTNEDFLNVASRLGKRRDSRGNELHA
jgi:hypothetical protein